MSILYPIQSPSCNISPTIHRMGYDGVADCNTFIAIISKVFDAIQQECAARG
jgi:hypothetical protein